jgi:hypothetical protein
MIVIIKGKNPKNIIVKILSMTSLVVMFYLYYGHMSEKFAQQNEQLKSKLNIKTDKKSIDVSRKIEQTIYKEAKIIVDLLEQRHIQSIEIKKNTLFIICDFNTDIEPLLVRYGVKALIKSTVINIKIALDLSTIVENKYVS